MAIIREAIQSDLPAMLEIYNDVILRTTSVYHYEPQSLESREEWFEAKKASSLPVFTAESQGAVAGFATFGPFRPWPAYQHTVEHSLYVDEKHRGQGIGKALLEKLIESCKNLGFHTMIGGIDADNHASIKLHTLYGFQEAGRLRQVGFKFERWLDLVFMQLVL